MQIRITFSIAVICILFVAEVRISAVQVAVLLQSYCSCRPMTHAHKEDLVSCKICQSVRNKVTASQQRPLRLVAASKTIVANVCNG